MVRMKLLAWSGSVVDGRALAKSFPSLPMVVATVIALSASRRVPRAVRA